MKTQLDEYDAIINNPSNEWLIFFWIMGVLELPPELVNNNILKRMQIDMQNPQRINIAKQLFEEYDRLGQDFKYPTAKKPDYSV